MKESLHLLGFPSAFRLNATVPLGSRKTTKTCARRVRTPPAKSDTP